MFGDIVLGVDHEKFEEVLDELKKERGVEEDPDLGVEDLDELIDTFKRIVEEEAERPLPGGAGSSSSLPSWLSSTPGTTTEPSPTARSSLFLTTLVRP